MVVGEIGATNFSLNMGHLGRTEPVVQPATKKDKEVALMRRILLMLAASALLVPMVVAASPPVFHKEAEQKG
jgi:hypothetical protein